MRMLKWRRRMSLASVDAHEHSATLDESAKIARPGQ